MNFLVYPVYAQVHIQADPSSEESHDSVKEKKSAGSGVVVPKKISYSKEDREKALVLLKRIFPQKSYVGLNELMAKHVEDGSISLTLEETQELSDVLSEEPDQTIIDKIQEFALGGSDTKGVLVGIEQLRKAFAENPLSLVPKDQVKETLLKQWEGKTFGEILKKYPKMLDFFASLIIDKNAVPQLLNIFQKKNELKYFVILVVITQVMCVLAFFALFRNSSWIGRVFKRSLLFLGVNCFLMLYFIWRFYPEVSPTLKIFRQVFFS